MPDDKTFDIPFHRRFVHDETTDVASEMAVENAFKKCFYLGLITLNFNFNSTIDQVSNAANHVVTGGDRSDRKTETHALHATLVQYLFRDHADTRRLPMR
jgi:hypothetical protein